MLGHIWCSCQLWKFLSIAYWHCQYLGHVMFLLFCFIYSGPGPPHGLLEGSSHLGLLGYHPGDVDHTEGVETVQRANAPREGALHVVTQRPIRTLLLWYLAKRTCFVGRRTDNSFCDFQEQQECLYIWNRVQKMPLCSEVIGDCKSTVISLLYICYLKRDSWIDGDEFKEKAVHIYGSTLWTSNTFDKSLWIMIEGGVTPQNFCILLKCVIFWYKICRTSFSCLIFLMTLNKFHLGHTLNYAIFYLDK